MSRLGFSKTILTLKLILQTSSIDCEKTCGIIYLILVIFPLKNMNIKILFQGNYSNQNVTCHFNQQSLRKIDPVIEQKAVQLWQQKIQQAQEAGKKIWDQPVYRLDKFHLDRDNCVLDFSTIPFSIRTSLKDFTEDLVKKGEDYLPMAVYSSIFIETTDGVFVFGEKSDEFVANHKYSYIGGVSNQIDGFKGDPNPFVSASSEITEELGIEDNDIEEVKLLGGLKTESCNLALVFYSKLKLNQKEVMKKFKIGNDLEMENLFFAKKGDLQEVCLHKIGKEAEFFDIFQRSGQQ